MIDPDQSYCLFDLFRSNCWMKEPDQTDLRLLEQLQIDCRTPITQLADIGAASTASVQRRLRQLRAKKIVKCEIANIDRQALGFEIKAFVAVELERDTALEINAFKQKAIDEAYVQHCYCIAGEVDFMLLVVAKNLQDYEEFTQRFFFAYQNIRKFKTSMVVSEQKATNKLPISLIVN